MRKIEISAYSVDMSSQWKREVSYKREESLNISAIRVKAPENEDSLSITPEAKKLINGNQLKENSKVEKSEKPYITLSEEDKQKIKILEALLSKLTGKKVKIKIPVFVKNKGDEKKEATQQSRLSWQIDYKLHESYEESEKLSFSSEGIVKTADGKEINFDLKLNMSREYAVEHNFNLKATNGEPIDPLVINYSGKAAEFKDKSFEFDLTADGKMENIPYLEEGSGFLVLADEEKVEDGSQLFGPRTGDGFEELAEYDEDNNGWLDSGDSIFEDLKIWTRDENGNDRLFALADKNIGAIYTANVQANYSHKSSENQTLAQNKKMGIYLHESGKAGTVQELDFIV
ncbi:MAG: hypothetical protein ACQEQF_09185 [Bacillota bacterium]